MCHLSKTPRPMMLRSDRLILRAVEPEDLDTMYLVENDTRLWPHGLASVPFSAAS